MADSRLQNMLKHVIFNVGDIIIDMSARNVGVLLSRERHIDIIEDDMYFWTVKWSKNNEILNLDYIEEEHLKFLILINKVKWNSSKGENCDLRMERL
jgi:hypothetical protein|tara:strand:+ start:428 stop:718 length:291 start_codon:yes stop_codon:yes gene_type:complete